MVNPPVRSIIHSLKLVNYLCTGGRFGWLGGVVGWCDGAG